MAENLVSIGIAYDTSQLVAGSRQVQTAMQQLTQAEKQTHTASEQLARSSTHTAQALTQESQAASHTSQSMQQAGQSTRTLTQQTQTLVDAATKSADALNRQRIVSQQAGQATQTMGQQARTTQSLLANLGQSIIALGGAAVAFHTLRAAIEGVVSAALKLEAVTAAFTAITGSAKAAATEMTFVRETAGRFGVQVSDLADSYKSLLAATQGTNMAGEKTRQLFLGITMAGRAVALSSNDIAGAMRPISQILNQQAIQGDEWRNEFGSRIPKAMDLLLRATNGAVKSQGELSDAMEQGKLKGDVVFDVMSNVATLLVHDYARAADAAAQGTAAAFGRMQTAVTDLQVALGRELLPALTDVANAITNMLKAAQGADSAFGKAFSTLVREAASAVIGLAGSIAVLGKAMQFMRTPLDDTEALIQRWQELKEVFLDVVTAQQQIVNPPQLTRMRTDLPKPAQAAPALGEIRLGEGKEKKAAKTDEEKAEAKAVQERLSLQKQLNDAFEKELYSERELLDIHLKRAGFAAADREFLLRKHDDTELLKEDNKLREDRLALDKTLQEALDKQVYSERELLQRKMEGLRYSEEEIKVRLKQYDTEKQLREEKEKQVEAERDAIQATKEHENTVERLMAKLEPQRRRMSRREQLQEAFGELATETSDPYLLAQADIKIKETLDTEAWQTWRDFATESLDTVGDAITQFAFHGKLTFKEMTNAIAEDFFRMSLKMVTESAFSSAGGKGGWLDLALQAGKSLLGIAGGVSGGGGGRFAGGDAPGMQHGGTALAGMPYWVGEAGPELVVPKTTSTVIPHQQSMAMAAPTINFYIQGVTNPNEWRPSQGAIQRTVAAGVSQAYRGL